MLSSFINDVNRSRLFMSFKDLNSVLDDLRLKFPTLFNLNTSIFSGIILG
jgi:hypothetical protein